MNPEITSPEYTNEYLNSLLTVAQNKLNEIKESNFSNKLDFAFEKSKLTRYVDFIESVKVSFNKLDNDVDKFTLSMVKSLDVDIQRATEQRNALPNSDEAQLDEAGMMKRGEISGEIIGLVDVKVLVFEVSSYLARKLARMLNKM